MHVRHHAAVFAVGELAALELAEVGPPFIELHLDVHPDLGQLGRHGLGILLVLQVAPLAGVQGELESVRVTGLLEQLTRLVGIVGVGFERGIEPLVDGRQGTRGPGGVAFHDGADDFVHVDAVVHGLADAHVLHGPGVDVVQGDEDDPPARGPLDRGGAAVVDLFDEVRRDVRDEIDLPHHQGGNPRPHFGDDAHDQLVDRRYALPVIFIFGQNDLAVLGPAGQLVGSGAHRVFGQVFHSFLPGELGRCHEDFDQIFEQGHERLLGGKPDGVVVDDFHPVDAVDQGVGHGHVGLVEHEIEGKFHCLGIEDFAVVEPDPPAQFDDPGQVVRPFIGFSQFGDHFHVPVPEKQGVIQVPQDPGGGRVHGEHRVQAAGVGIEADDHLGFGLGQGSAQQRADEQDGPAKSDEIGSVHRRLLSLVGWMGMPGPVPQPDSKPDDRLPGGFGLAVASGAPPGGSDPSLRGSACGSGSPAAGRWGSVRPRPG